MYLGLLGLDLGLEIVKAILDLLKRGKNRTLRNAREIR